jgi:hypothetical protein
MSLNRLYITAANALEFASQREYHHEINIKLINLIISHLINKIIILLVISSIVINKKNNFIIKPNMLLLVSDSIYQFV